MMNSPRTALCGLLISLVYGSGAFAGSPEDARSVIDVANLTGGLVVHLGAEDGVFTATLRRNESIVVHGLVDSPDILIKAREYVVSKGLSGPVSFALHTGKWMRGVNFDENLDFRDTFAPHLFCSAGFLDDTWWELTYWIYGKEQKTPRAPCLCVSIFLPAATPPRVAAS
jgi:hypothetical protein